MSYNVNENTHCYVISGNTYLYKEIFKAYGGRWCTTHWEFDKFGMDSNKLKTMLFEVEKIKNITPLVIDENNTDYMIKGFTTPYKEIIKSKGGKWINCNWCFDKLKFSRPYVETIIGDILCSEKNETVNFPQQSEDETDNRLMSMSNDDLKKEIEKLSTQLDRLNKILRKRSG